MAEKAANQSPLNGTVELKCVVICSGSDVAGQPKTVAKKLLLLGAICEVRNQKNVINYRLVDHIQFDELQTIEHTKCRALVGGDGGVKE